MFDFNTHQNQPLIIDLVKAFKKIKHFYIFIFGAKIALQVDS